MTETTTLMPRLDAIAALDDLLADVGLSVGDAGGRVTTEAMRDGDGRDTPRTAAAPSS